MRTKVKTSDSYSRSFSQVGNSLRDGIRRGRPPRRRKPPLDRLHGFTTDESRSDSGNWAVVIVKAKQLRQQNASPVLGRTRRFPKKRHEQVVRSIPARPGNVPIPTHHGSLRITERQTVRQSLACDAHVAVSVLGS